DRRHWRRPVLLRAQRALGRGQPGGGRTALAHLGCRRRPPRRGARPTTPAPPAPAEARAAASADRFAVLGAGAGALQLGLCLVVAAWLRRRQQLVGVLLARRGASSTQLTGVTLLQAVPAVILGVLVVTGVAALVVALRASASGTGAGLAAA